MKSIANRILFDRHFLRNQTVIFILSLAVALAAAIATYEFVANKVASTIFKSIHNEIVKNDNRALFQKLSTVNYFDSVEAYSADGSFHFESGTKKRFFDFSLLFFEPEGGFTVIFNGNPFQGRLIFNCGILSLILSFIGSYYLRRREVFREIQTERHYNLLSLAKISSKLAHDIRSPLTAIGMVSQVLNAQNIEQSKEILNSAFLRLNNMNSELFDRAKQAILESNRVVRAKELSEDIFNYSDLLNELKCLIEEKKAEHCLKSNQILLNSQGAHCFGYGSTSEILRIISNLINNSIESVPPHEIFRIKVEISCSLRGNTISLSIADNGNGMDKLKQSKIFEIGFTEKPSSRVSGNGLALHFAKEYLSECGGSIQFKSELGVGTVVQLAILKVDEV